MPQYLVLFKLVYDQRCLISSFTSILIYLIQLKQSILSLFSVNHKKNPSKCKKKTKYLKEENKILERGKQKIYTLVWGRGVFVKVLSEDLVSWSYVLSPRVHEGPRQGPDGDRVGFSYRSKIMSSIRIFTDLDLQTCSQF